MLSFLQPQLPERYLFGISSATLAAPKASKLAQLGISEASAVHKRFLFSRVSSPADLSLYLGKQKPVGWTGNNTQIPPISVWQFSCRGDSCVL